MRAVLIITLISVIAICTHAQQPLLRHFTIKDGLPSNVVYNMYQDAKGFMWFCTDQGVSQFNGAAFRNYSINEGVPDNEVFNMHEDEYGRLWLMCYNQQPCFIKAGQVYNASNDNLCRMIERKQINYVYGFTGKDKRLHLEGSRICAIYKDSIAIKHEDVPATNGANIYTHISDHEYFIRGGILHVKMDSRIKSKRLAKATVQASAVRRNLFSVIENGNHKNTLRWYSLDKDSAIKRGTASFPLFFYQLEYTTDSTLLCLTSKGIFEFNMLTHRMKHLNFPKHKSFNRMARDSEGNVWLSTLNDGVYVQRKEQSFIYNTGSGLIDNNVLSIDAQPTGKIIANFGGSTFCLINGNVITNVPLLTADSLNRIKFAHQIKDNDFIAGSDRGLYRIDLAGGRSMISPNAYKTCMRRGAIFFIGHSSGAMIYNSRNDRTTSLWDNRTTAIAAKDTNQIWLGSLNGLYIYRKGRVAKFNRDSAISNSRITSLAYIDSARLVIATHRNGLYIWDGHKLNHINKANGLQSDNCTKVTTSPEGELWLCTDQGLDRIIFNRYPAFSVYHYSGLDGLPTNKVNDVAVDKHWLYIATTEGIIKLQRNTGDSRIQAPKVYITSVTSRDCVLHYPDRPIELSCNQNDLQINYTGVSLSAVGEISYRYILEGASPDTVYTRLNEINLSTIRPGSYRFSVWAKAGQKDDWSDAPAIFSFTVTPPFWQTGWSLTTAGGTLFLLIIGVYRRKVRSIRRTERQKLEQQQKIASLEMQALRAQINPHFMFNALNSIQHFYSQNNERKANHYMGLFAQLIRKTLNNSKMHWLSLEEELGMLTMYIQLEQMRFKDAFEYEIAVGERINPQKLRLPVMLIQPYVENAINHGLRPLRERKGKLMLSFDLIDDVLSCRIEDNGIGIHTALKSRHASHKAMGMEINRQRMEVINQIYKTAITIEVVDKSMVTETLCGTAITITIPGAIQ